MPSHQSGEAQGDSAKAKEALEELPRNKVTQSKRPEILKEERLDDGSPDKHPGQGADEQLLDSAEDLREDYPQFAHDFEAPAQEQVDAPGDRCSSGFHIELPPPPFPPEPLRSPVRATEQQSLKRPSTSLRPLLPTSSTRLTAAHRAELLRHAAFFQERRQQLLDEIGRERQAVSCSSAALVGKLTGPDAEALLDSHHARIMQVVFDELDMEVGRALAHASSLFTRIEILHAASNGASGLNGASGEVVQPPPANRRLPEPPAPPPPQQSPSRTNGQDMPPIERRTSVGSRSPALPVLPAPPFVSPGQEGRWRASSGGAGRTQPESAAERNRSKSRSRSRSRSGPRVPTPPPMPIVGQDGSDGASRNFTAEIFERVVNGKCCWQAEIMQARGATLLAGDRVYAVRAPQRRSREEAEADGEKLTVASVDGSKAVRLAANELARRPQRPP